jgi:ubiquinone/menaquinone biosynthesis C-methylase UbiE
VGCGDGRFCWEHHACPPTYYTGLDVSQDLLDTLKQKTNNQSTTVLSVAEQIPLDDCSVDLVVCAECFEHLPRPDLALQEFSRVLKPGGKIVIQTPSALRLRNFNPIHLVSLLVGYWIPSILLRKVIHEHTFTTTYTYHWDFTRQDFEGFAMGCPGLEVKSIRGTTYRFNPTGSGFHRFMNWMFHLPVVHWLGWDLTVVLRKV